MRKATVTLLNEKRAKAALQKKLDTFWADTAIYKGSTNKNLSEEHDRYLYEKE